MAYDRADFDYSTEDDLLPKGHAAIHIGMFLAWAAANDLVNDYHRTHSAELLEKLNKREITGREFFQAACRDQFSERDLNPEGNAFTQVYYESGPGKRGPYFEDYKRILASKVPSFWHVADNWENYDRLAPVLTQRFQEWKSPPKKRWWQFWK